MIIFFLYMKGGGPEQFGLMGKAPGQPGEPEQMEAVNSQTPPL